MELIKRKILLEDSIDRSYDSKNWGKLTADTFFINVLLTQNIDDMGLFTDIEYFSASTDGSNQPNYSILVQKLIQSGITFPFMSQDTPYLDNTLTVFEQKTIRKPFSVESEFYNYLDLRISGYTDSKIDDVKSYDNSEKLKTNFNMGVQTYENYQNVTVNGVDRVVSLSEPIVYVFDTPVDFNIGTPNQVYGLQYLDYTANTRTVIIDNVKYRIPETIVNYIGEGNNETNTSLSALTKEEYLFGIISTPQIQNDVFIERGVTSVIEPHMKLSEIKNLRELTLYGNGYYNITRQ
jgi:hypothetical protein